MTTFTVRPAAPPDADAWVALRDALWPGSRGDHEREIARHFDRRPARETCFVAVTPDGAMVGFAELRLREYAEDCHTSPVGFLEGIYVLPAWRRAGVGQALVRAGEQWARSEGCTEMASDRELDNEASGAFHEATGFTETVRMVCYRKVLVDATRRPRTPGSEGARRHG